MHSSGFLARFHQFSLLPTTDWTPTLQDTYNKLQQENTTIRKAVELKLRKLPMGGVPWSPALQILRDTIELWCMIVKRKKHIHVSLKLIRRLLRRVPQARNAFTCSLTEALHQQSLAYKAYQAARKAEAVHMRTNFQFTLAEAIALKREPMRNPKRRPCGVLSSKGGRLAMSSECAAF